MVKENLQEEIKKFINYHIEQEYSTNTIRQYEHVINQFIRWIPKEEILNKQLCINYKKYLESTNLKYSSINNWITILNKFFKSIKREDLVLQKFKIQKAFAIEYALTNTDYKRLLRFCKIKEDYQTYFIIKILTKTGIRINELNYFTVENLSSFIEIKSKGKIRMIFVPKDLVRELRKYARENKIKKGTLFPSKKKDGMITYSCIWKRLKSIAGMARVNKKPTHSHSFRHLYAVNFLDQYPNDIAHLADLLGHKQLETTRSYGKLTENQMLSMVEKIKFNK